MKQFLPIFIVLSMLVSCSSSLEDIPIKDELCSITFQPKKNAGRTVVESPEAMGSFSVWGGFGTTDVFTGDDVTLDVEKKEWSYDNPRLWTYNTYNFYAVYPISTEADYNATNNTFTISNYNVKDNHDVDLLISTVEDHEYPKDGSVVNLNFKHALVQVLVKAKKDEDAGTITVTSVSLYGMPTEGSYSSSTGAWSFSAYSNETTPYYGSSLNKSLTTSATNMMDAMLMFPTSSISTTYMLHIEYKIGEQAFDKDIQLSATSIDKWEAGNVYSYTFTVIDENKIIFDTPKVVPWTASNGNIIIVE